MLDDRERRDVALWCLTGNRCWLGLTVERKLGKVEYCAIYLSGVYKSPAMVPDSYSDDPWESLRIGKEWLLTSRVNP